jgi:hypothetical protein
VLTGHSNAQLMSVALALDVNGFFIKPVVPAVFYEKMEKAANIVQINVREVRPNMILRANILAKDGTLMVSAGRVFNEVSINRLKELIGVLKSETITVEDPLKNNMVAEPPTHKVYFVHQTIEVQSTDFTSTFISINSYP